MNERKYDGVGGRNNLPTNMGEMKMDKTFCTECGAPVAADDAFCEHCGARLAAPEPAAPVPAAPVPAESPRKAPGCLLGLLVIVLATVLLIAVLLGIRRLRGPGGVGEVPPASGAGAVQPVPVAPGSLIPPGDREAEPPPAPEARPLPPPPPGAGFQKFGEMSEEEFMEYSRGLWERSRKENQ